MSSKKDIFLSMLKKVRVSLISWDTLAFCFFLLFAAGIWYIHASSSSRLKASRAESQPTIFQESPYTEKRLEVPLTATGVPSGKEILPFVENVVVTVRVKQDHYNSITPDDLKAECAYSSSDGNTLKVTATCSNPDASIISVAPEKVEYLIQDKK